MEGKTMTKATKTSALKTVAKKVAARKATTKPATVRKPRTRKAKVAAHAPVLLLTGPKVRVAPVNVLPSDDTVICLPGPVTTIKHTRGAAKSVVIEVPYLGESRAYINSKDTRTGAPIWFSSKTSQLRAISIDRTMATIEVPMKVLKARNLEHLAA